MSLEAALHQGLLQMDLSLKPNQVQALLQYLEQLQKWGKVFNLTAIKNPIEALHLHLLDCLALVVSLRNRYRDSFKGKTLTVLDVGSGAGLPAIVLAICHDPDHLAMHITSVDAVEKKIAFQQQQKALLQLTQFVPLHQRIETLQSQPFDLITCRAFASLADFCSQTQHLAQSPSSSTANQQAVKWVAMKAKLEADEQRALAQLSPAVEIVETESVTVPGLAVTRQFVWLGTAVAKSISAKPNPI